MYSVINKLIYCNNQSVYTLYHQFKSTYLYFSVDYFHIPVVMSFPHFYLAAEQYKNSVGGLSPNKEEHQTHIDLEHVGSCNLVCIMYDIFDRNQSSYVT